MATTANPPPGAFALEDHDASDPFVTSAQDAQRHRYSAFDNSQFSLYLNGSPGQAKRALQAHLSETKRRLQETSNLGNSLVQQKAELEEKLKEVEKQHEDTDIGPELRQRLAALEKEFNEVGRETARAFLPKSRVPSGETDTTAGASVYSSEAHHSPSKVSVPSRKQRNQQPSRINDIALATEISTSLLSQLKELQAVLLEKDEALRAANLDRSQLEIEVEGMSQRMRALDESESRLKDVNWNLETQVREFEAAAKAAADKEHRLNQTLNLARSEKSTLEREFEELKQIYAKLTDDHTSKSKHHETELSSLRRNVSMGETERGALQRKVDELASQNQELAKAVAYRMRGEDQETMEDTSPSDGGEEGDTITPEHSPPPSPSKATPRHGQLESETLKHSLHHAHRMIQQLKNNIHREKTEKIELKRMLQDARDELESNRNSANGPGSASKRRKNDKDVFKKPARPDRLGALRTGSQEVVVDDDEWEEQEGIQATPSRRSKNLDSVPGAFPSGFSSAAETGTDEFETANETSDAFETANERDGTATETDAFQTGAETLDGDSTDDLTETEAGPSDTIRGRPSSLALAGNRKSYQSTASTSGDEDDDYVAKTPIQSQHPRFKLKMRQAFRRSTPRGSQELFASTPPAKDSPASFVSGSNNSTPAQGKSLFAELGALSGESEDGSVADGTPSRSSILSPESSPEVSRKSLIARSPLQSVSIPKPTMVDSSMMTEPMKSETPIVLGISSVSTMDTEPKSVPQLPLYMSSLSMQNTEPKPPSQPSLHMSSFSTQDTTPKSPLQPSLHMSSFIVQDTAPKSPPPPSLHMSTVSTQGTDPVSPVVEKFVPPTLNISSIAHQTTEPEEPQAPDVPAHAPLLVSSFSTQATEPLEPSWISDAREQVPLEAQSLSSQTAESRDMLKEVPLQVSSLSSLSTEPQEATRPSLSKSLAMSYQATEPLEPRRPAPSQLSILSSQATEPIEAAKAAPPQISVFSTQATEPVEPPRTRLQISVPYSQATAPVEPPRRPLSQVSAITVQHTSPVEPPVVLRPKNRFSDVMVLQDTQPESPTLPAFLPSPTRPSTAHRVPPSSLSLSDILSQETEPEVRSRPVTAHRNVPAAAFTSSAAAQTEDQKDKQEGAKLGFFSSVLPWNKTTPESAVESEPTTSTSRDGRVPLAPISSNAVQTDRSSSPTKAPRTPTADNSTQTMVSADQIDRILAARNSQRHSGSLAAAGIEKRMSPPASPKRSSVEAYKIPRRPGSSGSIRSRTASPPPLPADHKEVIAAAALKSPPVTPGAPPTTPGAMGPPTMPASAYKKRPQTPSIKTNNLGSSPKTGGTTPRARYQAPRSDYARSGTSSPITRRSSVSSFASEVDHRFDMAANPFAQSGFDPNTTDPRMIQAITQTMIGEFLWKYTRKAGRGDMSEKRHRRFFWVHPYTRTLYWSEQDPATAGRAQLKAKSVAIESVQVVTDDNPFPPGLHRKSLVVVTPGRTIKFTATTGQRHETWFNALSYLLLRTGEDVEEQKVATDEVQSEFNPGFRSSSRQTGRSRASLTSHVSRRTSSPHHAQIPTLRHSTVTEQRASSTEVPQGSMSGRLSSLSGMFRQSSGLRGSFSSRRSRASTQDTAYNQSEERDSRYDLVHEMNQKHLNEDHYHMDGMENVRACCDGEYKFDFISISSY